MTSWKAVSASIAIVRSTLTVRSVLTPSWTPSRSSLCRSGADLDFGILEAAEVRRPLRWSLRNSSSSCSLTEPRDSSSWASTSSACSRPQSWRALNTAIEEGVLLSGRSGDTQVALRWGGVTPAAITWLS